MSFNDYEQKFGKAREIATEIKQEYQRSLIPPKKDPAGEFLESHRNRLVASKKIRPPKKQGFNSDYKNNGAGESDEVEADIEGGESYDREFFSHTERNGHHERQTDRKGNLMLRYGRNENLNKKRLEPSQFSRDLHALNDPMEPRAFFMNRNKNAQKLLKEQIAISRESTF